MGAVGILPQFISAGLTEDTVLAGLGQYAARKLFTLCAQGSLSVANVLVCVCTCVSVCVCLCTCVCVYVRECGITSMI